MGSSSGPALPWLDTYLAISIGNPRLQVGSHNVLRFVLLVSSLTLLDVTFVGTVFSGRLLQPGRDEVCFAPQLRALL
jgi:hypothetical protein